MNRKTINSIVRAYNKGASLKSLSETHGCAVGTIRKTLVEEGVEIRRRGRPVSR